MFRGRYHRLQCRSGPGAWPSREAGGAKRGGGAWALKVGGRGRGLLPR